MYGGLSSPRAPTVAVSLRKLHLEVCTGIAGARLTWCVGGFPILSVCHSVGPHSISKAIRMEFYEKFGGWEQALQKGCLSTIKRQFQEAMCRNARGAPEKIHRNYGTDRHGKS